jgi:hypothetical protein
MAISCKSYVIRRRQVSPALVYYTPSGGGMQGTATEFFLFPAGRTKNTFQMTYFCFFSRNIFFLACLLTKI